MPDSDDRASRDSPGFVWTRANRTMALAAGFAAGTTVLDLGSGDEMQFYQYVKEWCTAYVAVDIVPPREGPLPLPPPGVGYSDVGVFAFLDQNEHARYDTVAMLEMFEHIDPTRQLELLERAWGVTARRMIVTCQPPDVRTHYPRTEFFSGASNPTHLREIHEWQMLDYVYALPGRAEVFAVRCDLTPSDEGVFGLTRGPAALYMVVVERGG